MQEKDKIYAPSMEFRLDARLSVSYARCTMTNFDLLCNGCDQQLHPLRQLRSVIDSMDGN